MRAAGSAPSLVVTDFRLDQSGIDTYSYTFALDANPAPYSASFSCCCLAHAEIHRLSHEYRWCSADHLDLYGFQVRR